MGVDPAPKAAQPGPTVLVSGRYLLGPVLGRGGAAEVYWARDQVLGRAVAVKIFPAGVAGPDSHRQRREMVTLAGLSHPGLVTIYDAGNEDGRAFLVMQLVQGRTLADQLAYGPLPAAEVAQLGIAMAEALAYVHGRGVVHRDVKPGNVLLDGEGRPHLSDFGIATLVDATQITGNGLMIGTAAYLAPEQVRGHPVTASTDVYALGLVLLECLTGRREYGGNPMEVALARLHRPPVIPDGLPAPMVPLLRAMTAEDPKRRPSAAEVAQRLRNGEPARSTPTAVLAAPPPPAAGAATPPATLLFTAPTPTASPGAPSKLAVMALWRRPHRKVLLVAALVAIAIASVLAIALPSRTPAPATTTPEVPAQSALPTTPPLIPSPPGDGLADLPGVNQDGAQ